MVPLHIGHNRAFRGGGFFLAFVEASFLGISCWYQNHASNVGGGISLFKSSLLFKDSAMFEEDRSEANGGAIFTKESKAVFYENITFKFCTSKVHGGGMYLINTYLDFKGQAIIFVDNSAGGSGGAISGYNLTITMQSELINFANNSGEEGGALHTAVAPGSIQSNYVSIVGSVLFENNSALYSGGAVSLEYTQFSLSGNLTEAKSNRASIGGWLFSYGGKVLILCELLRTLHNSVTLTGGAIHLERAILDIQAVKVIYECNTAHKGGVIHASISNLHLLSEQYFWNNSAYYGGALYLSNFSHLYLYNDVQLSFTYNTAHVGGAIFVLDSSYSDHCFKASSCFFEVNVKNRIHNQLVYFYENFAESGADLFGGFLDRCFVLEFIATKVYHTSGRDSWRLYFKSKHSKNANVKAVSSDPVRLCFCTETHLPNCSFVHSAKSIHRGEQISFSVAIVDQNEHSFSFLAVRAELSENSRGVLGEGEYVQTQKTSCDPISLHVFSPNEHETLSLLSDKGPCRDVGISKVTIALNLLPCPLGFQLSRDRLKCVCHQPLTVFTTSCDIDNQSILRQGNFWFSYENSSLVVHRQCPFDFCVRETENITVADIDKQCAFNRSGTLCGACGTNFSLSLGSSRCQPCHSPSFVWLTLLFALAGVFLVFFLLCFQLTVSTGTINTLLFFSNIVVINKPLMFPSGSTSNPLLVLLAWLNLDLGIETCYYDGMDMYGRTWLQFVFPFYVWSMVGLIIIVSHYSTYAAKLFGRNPVAVLATLFLLSYTKLLRTIITIFSFALLRYPETETRRVVWLYDGNINYLTGKHIPLFIAALLVLLLLFLPYTAILMLGQFFRKHSHKNCLHWARSPVFTSVMDAYHAPYKTKHRYWTGLLLLVRCALFLTFSFNALGDPTFNLLAVIITAMFLILLAAYLKVYKNKLINFLQLFFLTNLGVLSVIIHPASLSELNKERVNNISLAIVFLVFCGILLYHSYLQIKDTNFWRRLQERRVKAKETASEQCEIYPKNTPTTTVVELRDSNYLEPLLEDSDHCN